MGLARTTAAFMLAVIMMRPGPVTAAQGEFDIDLKELRHGGANEKPQYHPQPSPPASTEIDLRELRRIAPPLASKPAQRKRHVPTAAAPRNVESGRESIHLVQPGEHLFLILMKQYGLSNQAAEQLIPEIMRLNGITSPKGLKVGQRLRIPLAARDGKNSSIAREARPQTGQQTTTTLPDTAPAAAPEPAAPPSTVRSISIMSAPPCKLAHDILEPMGLLTSSSTRIQGAETVSAASAGRSITIACGLSKAEIYTYERLLARNGKQLVTFDGDESEDCVVEKLSTHLGLVFCKRDPDSATLPQTYVFAPFGTGSQELQLTIMPASPAPST